MKKAIGFIGSASRETKPEDAKNAFELGKLAAEKGFVAYSGGCPGLPLEAIKGAKSAGGLTIGIVPAGSFGQHTEEWDYPHEEFDSLIFTGMGRGRNFLLIRACDAVVVLEGRVGTLNEVTSAWEEGKIIGVLEGFGGIASHMREIEQWLKVRDMGAKAVFAKTPKELIEKIAALL